MSPPDLDAATLGEKILSLLEESARSSTYKPALLLALVDAAPEHSDARPLVTVRRLAERVIELYWPQTLAYPTTGDVLLQNQAGGQASIVRRIVDFRTSASTDARALPEALRSGPAWRRLADQVELTLAEWPIPRLQVPYEPFLYTYDWPLAERGDWRVGAYRRTSRAVRLLPGVAEGLVALGPLLRPFITRWWTDKAAQLNPQVEAARSVVEFEQFLFGRDRVALERIGESLLDLQQGSCFYCREAIGRHREIDHFVPWSHSGDDGLDNLVAACRRCNQDKRAALPAAAHLEAVLARNREWDADLAAIASERAWPRHPARTLVVMRSAYLRGPAERQLWLGGGVDGARLVDAGRERGRLVELLGKDAGIA